VPPWACGEVASWELGWSLSGFARSIAAAARRRAALWGDEGLAGHYFRRGHHSPGRTWAKVSLQVLHAWKVPDLPECLGTTGEPVTEERYKKVVKELLQLRCRARWREAIQRRAEPLPFALYCAAPSALHHELLMAGGDWAAQSNVRGWCRLRTQAVQLAEREGLPSRARDARCIFCGTSVGRAEYHHVLAECPVWAERRAVVEELHGIGGGPRRVLRTVLAVLRPDDLGAEEARALAAAIDSAAREHWASRGWQQ
jgi:hypothetical protein